MSTVPKVSLEICCYQLSCALIAEQLGADRIELCSGAQEGGLTPSWGVLQLARQQLSLAVHPIIRPRGGDFCYSDSEFAVIKRDLQAIKQLGFAGVVLGLLTVDGDIDLARMEQLMTMADGLSVTFHRAFDMCRQPIVALQQLTSLGVDRILTSGQQATAQQGLALLQQLQTLSQGPIIMAGGGVRVDNLEHFLAAGVRELHSAATMLQPSAMRFQQPQVTMSRQSSADEFHYPCLDPALLAQMIEKKQQWQAKQLIKTR